MSGSYLFSQEWRPGDLRDEDLMEEAREMLADLNRERDHASHGEGEEDQGGDEEEVWPEEG